MGKDSRTSRKRSSTRADKPVEQRPTRRYSVGRVLPSLALAVVVLIGAFVWLSRSQVHPPATTSGTPIAVSGRSIDHITCSAEMLNYHVHAHLTILDRGRPVKVPAYVGITNSCLYWLHTHDDSGIIHVEAPHAVKLTLGNFFDIWGEPLSSSNVAGHSVKPGDKMRVFLNLKPRPGDPRSIALRPNANITVEVGPPFEVPQPYDFKGL